MTDLIPATLALRHEPDRDVTKDGDGVPVVTELPGMYTLGFVTPDGAFHPLQRIKAGGIHKRIALAKAAAEKAAAEAPPEPPPAA